MDAFLGTWKVALDRSTGLKDFGKAFGMPDEVINKITTMEYTFTLQKEGDGFKCILDYGVQKMELPFKLGEGFDYTSITGTTAKCVVTSEGNKLLEKFTTDQGASWTTERSVSGGEMKMETSIDGTDVTAVQILVKV